LVLILVLIELQFVSFVKLHCGFYIHILSVCVTVFISIAYISLYMIENIEMLCVSVGSVRMWWIAVQHTSGESTTYM